MLPDFVRCSVCQECWRGHQLDESLMAEINDRIVSYQLIALAFAEGVILKEERQSESFSDAFQHMTQELTCLLRWRRAYRRGSSQRPGSELATMTNGDASA